MEIETIFFDAGNTLCHLNMSVLCDVLAEFGCTVTPETLRESEPRARRFIDTDEVVANTNDTDRWLDYLRGILDEAGIDSEGFLQPALSRLQVRQARQNIWNHLPEDVLPLLTRLKEKEYRLAVVSNSNGTVEDKLGEIGIARFFEAILDSHIEGLEKPDPGLFHRAIERIGADPERTIHVGDLYHVDVIGAQRAGLQAVLLDPAGLHADKAVPRIRRIGELEAWLETRGR